jgi:hypothetical protein
MWQPYGKGQHLGRENAPATAAGRDALCLVLVVGTAPRMAFGCIALEALHL